MTTTLLVSLLTRRGCNAFQSALIRQRSPLPHFLPMSTTAAETSTEETAAATPTEDSSIYVKDAEALSKVKSPFLKTLRDRGFLHQCTNLLELDAKLEEKQPQSAYLGFDATADSLHVGSLLQIMILRHLQQSGHQPVVLIGGGTSKVGDPTGKDESRVMMTEQIIEQNKKGISKVFQQFLEFDKKDDDDKKQYSNNPAIMVDNDDWLSELKYLDFLREYGTHFTINRMLSFESVKQRLQREAPFSFLEFNYMILQAYDFLELHRRHNVILQLGGSDQWGNMVSGTELGRRVDGAQLFALTAPLITTSDGKKMGKTANGAVWLNAEKLSEFDYWQFWRNTDDKDVIRFLKLFTELPLERIAELEKLQGSEINQAKIVLADEATALLHGPDCLTAIHETTQNMFAQKTSSGAGSTEGLPRTTVSKSDLEGEGVKCIDLFVELGLASTKNEARRLIQGGGGKISNDKIGDVHQVLTIADFDGNDEVILRAGKKRAGVVEFE